MHTITQQSLPQPGQITAGWIDELDRHLGWNDKPRSYRLLTAVLLAMRTGTDPADCEYGGEFPVRVCGTRCDDLPLGAMTEKSGNLARFFGRVALGFKPDPLGSPEGAVVTVLRLLFHRLSGLEFEIVYQRLPTELRLGQGSAHDDDS